MQIKLNNLNFPANVFFLPDSSALRVYLTFKQEGWSHLEANSGRILLSYRAASCEWIRLCECEGRKRNAFPVNRKMVEKVFQSSLLLQVTAPSITAEERERVCKSTHTLSLLALSWLKVHKHWPELDLTCLDTKRDTVHQTVLPYKAIRNVFCYMHVTEYTKKWIKKKNYSYFLQDSRKENTAKYIPLCCSYTGLLSAHILGSLTL